MDNATPTADSNLAEHTTAIVSAYLAKNQVTPDQIPDLIRSVSTAFSNIGQGANTALSTEPQRPAVSVKKSIQPDYLVCLEDGKKLKMLKRHLRTTYNLTPDQYRAKWNLPADYPMTARNYSASRSTLAKALGLGRRAEPEKPAARRGGRRRTAASADAA